MADGYSKACRKCGQFFPLSEFYKSSSNTDGLSTACKACTYTYQHERYERIKVLRPQSPIANCKHCGKEFPRAITNPPSTVKYCSLECRFWSKVEVTENPDDCWNWKAKAKSGHGYGIFNLGDHQSNAHRVSWMLSNGPIPDGLFVCHKCDNPRCCNPNHLFLGTPKDNTDDMNRKGRGWNMSMSPGLMERLRVMKIGVPRPPEVREKLRLASRGQKQSREAIAKRVAKTTGMKRSEDTKRRMREAQKRRRSLEKS